MDLLCAFADLCPEDVYVTIPLMDIHSLACTHRSIQKIVAHREHLKAKKAIDQQRNPSKEVVRRATEKIARAWTALQTEDPALLERLRKGLAEFKTMARRFVELSKRWRIPPLSRSASTYGGGSGEGGDQYYTYELVADPDAVQLLLWVGALAITIAFEYKRPLTAHISYYGSFLPRKTRMSAEWDKSVALAVAIVTNIYGVDMACIATWIHPDPDYRDPDVEAYIASFT